MPPHSNLTEEIAESAALYALGMLTQSERAAVDRHLAEGCSVCQSEISRCGDLLALWAGERAPAPPPALRQKLLRSMRQQKDSPSTVTSPVLLDRSGVLLLRSAKMEWKASGSAGVSVKVLANDSENEMTTMLVRMRAGSLYPPHRHKGVEEVYVLQGGLQVEGVDLIEGDFCVSQPESVHQASFTTAGCVLMVKTSKHNEVLN